MYQKIEENSQDAGIGLLTNYGGDKNGIPRIIFHAASGANNYFHLVIEHLIKQDIGPVIGISVADTKKYCETETERLIGTIATDYADQIATTGYKEFQLIGPCIGGFIAVEVGNRLLNKGLSVADLILLDSYPMFSDLEDDLLLEFMFVSNLNIHYEKTLAAAGLGEIDQAEFSRGIVKIFKENEMGFPKDALANLHGDEKLYELGKIFRKLSALTKRERFKIYLQGLPHNAETILSSEMAELMFGVYAKTTRASSCALSKYSGNIRYLKATEELEIYSGMGNKILDFWRNICQGDLKISMIEGSHFECVEVEPSASKVAQVIAEPFWDYKQHHK